MCIRDSFGDGAAAVVLTGGSRDSDGSEGGPSIVASGSAFYPDTERVMGWDVVDSGLKVVLSAQVPEIVRQNVRNDVDEFLAMGGHNRSSIRHWICLLYTSDAADERSSVDLGGRRIIKKTNRYDLRGRRTMIKNTMRGSSR